MSPPRSARARPSDPYQVGPTDVGHRHRFEKRITASRPSAWKAASCSGGDDGGCRIAGLVGSLLRSPHRVQLVFTGVAAVGQSTIQQGLNGIAVLAPLALNDRVSIPVDPSQRRPSRMFWVYSALDRSLSVSSIRSRKRRLVSGVKPVEQSCSPLYRYEAYPWAWGQTNAHTIAVSGGENGTDGSSNPQLPP